MDRYEALVTEWLDGPNRKCYMGSVQRYEALLEEPIVEMTAGIREGIPGEYDSEAEGKAAIVEFVKDEN